MVLHRSLPFLAALFLVAGCASNHVVRGDALYASGEYGRAAEAYRNAIDEDPQNTRIWRLYDLARQKASRKHTALGEIALERGDLAVAAVEFKKAVRYHPDNELARRNLEKARDLWDRTHDAYGEGRRLLGSGRGPEALAKLEPLLAYGVTYPDIEDLVAGARKIKGGEAPEATPEPLSPSNGAADLESLRREAVKRAEAGDIDAAIDVLEVVVKQAPKDKKSRDKLDRLKAESASRHCLASGMAIESGDFALAYRELRVADRLDPRASKSAGEPAREVLRTKALEWGSASERSKKPGLALLRYRQVQALGGSRSDVSEPIERVSAQILDRVNPSLAIETFEAGPKVPAELALTLQRALLSRVEEGSILRTKPGAPLSVVGSVVAVEIADHGPEAGDGAGGPRAVLNRYRVKLDQAEARVEEAGRELERARDQVVYWRDERERAAPEARHALSQRVERARRAQAYRQKLLESARKDLEALQKAYEKAQEQALSAPDGAGESPAPLVPSTREARVFVQFVLAGKGPNDRPPDLSEEVIGLAESWSLSEESTSDAVLLQQAAGDAAMAIVRSLESHLWEIGRPWRERATSSTGDDALDAAVTYQIWLDLFGGGNDPAIADFVERETGYRAR